jgi:hypothetical protein
MTSHQPPPLDLNKLPTDTWLTVNQVSKRCSVRQDDIKTMIGVLEKQAGGLPQEMDPQGKPRRVISESTLLPYFETAAQVMRVERINAHVAMERTLQLGVNHYLDQLTSIVSYLNSLREMPKELRDVAAKLREAARIPHRVDIHGEEVVLRALDDARRNSLLWRTAAGVLLCLLVPTVVFLLFLGFHR